MRPHSPHPALPQPSRRSPSLSSCSREHLSDLSRSCTSRAAGDQYCSEADLGEQLCAACRSPKRCCCPVGGGLEGAGTSWG